MRLPAPRADAPGTTTVLWLLYHPAAAFAIRAAGKGYALFRPDMYLDKLLAGY